MFLSRAAKRACLDTRILPPTFLLPFTASFGTASVSHTTDGSNTPSPLTNSALKPDSPSKTTTLNTPAPSSAAPSSAPALPTPEGSAPALSDSVRELLPLLRAQGPHYITAHLYDRPYLLTEGDTLRLPFLMHGVSPGDVLRLTHASTLGSRDFTLKAGASAPSSRSATSSTVAVIDPTPGSSLSSHSTQMSGETPHFVPHQAKGKLRYIDPSFFVVRATVLGTESEPLRIKEKTKRRQRRVKTVQSKHRFTILKVKEITIRSAEEIESGLEQ